MSVDIVERLRLNEDDWLFGQTARDARREITTLREQVAALAEQNEKLRDALPECKGWLDGEDCFERDTIELADEALSLPGLSPPVLNKYRAEGMGMAINWFEGRYPFSNLNEIRARADELRKQNG